VKGSRKSAETAGTAPAESVAHYTEGVRPLAVKARRMPPPVRAKAIAAPARAEPRGAAPLLIWKEQEDRLRAARSGHEGAVSLLARGELPLHGTLDLHGLTVALAEREVARFFARVRGPKRRAVIIVHGKGTHSPGGRSALREALALWLSSAPLEDAVLGFATARQRDGGAGALYVLLAPTA
jgi:DNA-nicking Smr family endonuclease